MQPNSQSRTDLPDPDALSAAHCDKVAQHIREVIKNDGGSISFAEFMHHALYASGLGYYAAGAKKFGEHGDFVTAPEVSPLFGYVIARQSAVILEQLGAGDVLEIGAGSGALAVSVLSKLAELDSLPQRYLIFEVSADLQERQRNRIVEEIPRLSDRVSWTSQLPAEFVGVIVANEVLDALPVERFLMRNERVLQARVSIGDGRFSWSYGAAPTLLENTVRQIERDIGQPLDDGYQSEVSPGVTNWIADLSASVRTGFVFLIDYGVSRSEYYAPERVAGWLRCHFRHHIHDNPLVLPGIQDLTAWVDFTAVATAAAAAGMNIAGYVTQGHFLAYGGLNDELTALVDLPIQTQTALSGQVKLLTLPSEMGESFKCLGLSRGDIDPPQALTIADRAHTL